MASNLAESYTAPEIRGELYDLLNALQDEQNYHLQAWSTPPNVHGKPCRVCTDYENKRNGIKRAIRHFGGKPHNW